MSGMSSGVQALEQRASVPYQLWKCVMKSSSASSSQWPLISSARPSHGFSSLNSSLTKSLFCGQSLLLITPTRAFNQPHHRCISPTSCPLPPTFLPSHALTGCMNFESVPLPACSPDGSTEEDTNSSSSFVSLSLVSSAFNEFSVFSRSSQDGQLNFCRLSTNHSIHLFPYSKTNHIFNAAWLTRAVINYTPWPFDAFTTKDFPRNSVQCPQRFKNPKGSRRHGFILSGL